MKRSIYSLTIIMVVLVAGCDKKLDLAPENTIVDKDVFKTEAGADQALAQAYYSLFESSTSGLGYSYGDFTTPILNRSTYYNVYNNGEATPVDNLVQQTWTNYFSTINIANNIIAKIPLFGAFSEAKKNQFVAESKFIRAYAYLDLLRLYGDGALTGKKDGLGVPLQLTPFQGYNTGDVIPRSTNQQVYTQIINDLKEIQPDLPDTYETDVKTRARATKGGANALLSRCYLYMQDYANAAIAAKAVLDKQPVLYTLMTDLRQLFPANPTGTAQTLSAEHIFGYPISQIISPSSTLDNNLGNDYYFKRSFWISHDFINEFEPGDLRVSQLMFRGDTIYNIEHLNERTTFKFNNNEGVDNVSEIRLAEVILTRAEALARTSSGLSSEAISLLNQVRSRSLPSAAPLTANDFINQSDLVEKILTQRKFELAFEGFYRYDLIRTGKPLGNAGLPEGKKVLPIPQIEIDVSNGIIKQNSGYVL